MKGFDPLRIRRMLRKELKQIFRDPRMKRIVFVAPVIQLVVFGYAVNTDIRETPMFVVDHSSSAESRRLVDALTASGYFRVAGRSERPADLVAALDRGRAILGLEIPPSYAADLGAGRAAEVQVLVDGSNSNTATIVQGNAARIIRGVAEARLRERAGGASRAGVDLRIRAWYNPDLASRVYNVPAVMGVIVMLMSVLLTAMTLVRERETGTLEQLMVTPLTPGELILGKTLPVALISLVQITLIAAVAMAVLSIGMTAAGRLAVQPAGKLGPHRRLGGCLFLAAEGCSRGDFAGAVVIPALAEEDSLFDTLRSLEQNPREFLSRFLVLVVVNHRADAEEAVGPDTHFAASLQRKRGPQRLVVDYVRVCQR